MGSSARKLWQVLTVVGFVALLAGGCRNMGGFDELPDFESGPREIAGTSWLAVDIDGYGAGNAAQSTISFSNDDQLSGKGGCNSFLGPYEVNGARVKFGPFAMTKMMCEPAIAEQEDAFLLALAKAATMEVDGAFMYLRDSAGNPVLSLSWVE